MVIAATFTICFRSVDFDVRPESPRVLRKLNTLRGLSHEEVEQVLARGP